MAAFGSGGGKKGRRRQRDQEMARQLADAGKERTTGRCVICHATIGNGTKAYDHYAAHARGNHARE